MIYKVTAKLKQETASAFLRKLTDGTIAAQKPDGEEIVASMNRAVVSEDGTAIWSETCYCPSPLAHERATIYDHHFTDFTTREIDAHQTFEGRPFMTVLEDAAGKAGGEG